MRSPRPRARSARRTCWSGSGGYRGRSCPLPHSLVDPPKRFLPPPDQSAGVFVPAATTKPPDLSGGPLGCCSVFCVPGLSAKAVAGYLPAMFGIGADPPQVHRCKVHGRGQFAPDLAAWIKLALLKLR